MVPRFVAVVLLGSVSRLIELRIAVLAGAAFGRFRTETTGTTSEATTVTSA